MEMRTDLGASGDQAAELVIRAAGVERTQPEPPQSFELQQARAEPRQRILGVAVQAVGGEMETAEDDLPKAPGDETARPGQDHVSSGAPAGTAHRGNDAKRAAQVTAVLDFKQGPGAEGLFRRSLPGSKPGENTGRKLHLGGVRQQERFRGKVFIPESAAGDRTAGDDQPGARVEPGDPADELGNIPVRPGCQCAGVDDDQVGPGRVLLQPHPAELELLGPRKGLGLVHPAAEILNGERGHQGFLIFLEALSTWAAIAFLCSSSFFLRRVFLRLRIWQARMAALEAPALPNPMVATGTPLRIWTGESNASSPPSPALSTGTPMTGNDVFPATNPARSAAWPAPDMKTFAPFFSLSAMSALVRSGGRGAAVTARRWETPKSSRMWRASLPT